MQDDSRGYHIDLENLEIRIGGDCPDFLSAKTALVEYAKTRLAEAEKAVRIAQQNFLTAKGNFLRLSISDITISVEFQGARASLIESDYDLSVAQKDQVYALQDFIRTQQTKNPYDFQPYEDLGFAPHGPLTAINRKSEG